MNIQQQVVSKPRAVDIDYLLSRLSPELREVIQLRYFEDMSCQDIATRLACPRWKSKKLIYEGICTLRELCGVQVVQIAPGYEVRYFPHFLPETDADLWLSRLLAEVPFRPEKISLFGKQFVVRRQTALYGANYDYNDTAQQAREWSPLLTELKVLVQQAVGLRFQSALCNLYPDGEAYIGWHRDAGHLKMIASLSLGAVRELRFAETGSTRTVYGMELAHGSLLLILKAVNDHFKHMVPKCKHVTQPRINVTFRRFGVAQGQIRPE